MKAMPPRKNHPLHSTHYTLITIVGPTASGKSALAMQIAKELNGEIISADSWQVYKGFDIGTSKPSEDEQNEINHHLIDVTEPKDGFNAPKFKDLADKAVVDIQNRGKLPIMAGGTGLYIDSVLYDFRFLPNLGPKERAELDSMELMDLINLAAARKIDLTGIDIGNKRRVVRAIEAKGEKPSKKGLRKDTLIIGLNPPRDELRDSIQKRVKQMISDGLEKEVKDLAGKYGWDIEPMKGIGYKEWRPYFEGLHEIAETEARILKNTMDLAKRQMTWFKRSSDIKWFGTGKEAHVFLTKQL